MTKTMRQMCLDFLEQEHDQAPRKAVSRQRIQKHMEEEHGPEHMPSGFHKRINTLLKDMADEGEIVHVKGSYRLPAKSSRASSRAATKVKAAGVSKPKAAKAARAAKPKAKAGAKKAAGGRGAAAGSAAKRAKAPAAAKRGGGAKKAAALSPAEDLPHQTAGQAKKDLAKKRKETEALRARGGEAEEGSEPHIPTGSTDNDSMMDWRSSSTPSMSTFTSSASEEEEEAPARGRGGGGRGGRRAASSPSEEEMTPSEEEGTSGTSSESD